MRRHLPGSGGIEDEWTEVETEWRLSLGRLEIDVESGSSRGQVESLGNRGRLEVEVEPRSNRDRAEVG